MSRVSATPTAGPTLSAESLLGIGPKLLTASADSALAFLGKVSDILSPALPAGAAKQFTGLLRPRPLCDIPETECPPRCVYTITWEAIPGETLQCKIRVSNSSAAKRTFQVSATPFGGMSAQGMIALAPATLELAPGQSETVTATFSVPPDIASGRYESEILIRGSWEQCVCVKLHVQEEQRCHCEVVQGDPPVRVREHRWYDHFQCEEPCAPAHGPTRDAHTHS